MTQLEQKLVIPAAVLEKLESVRGRTLWVKLGTAIVAALGVLLAGMGVAMIVDLLATLYDSSWRTVLTSSALAAAGATFVVLLVVARRHSKRLDRVAAQVDREIPQLEERWTTVADLSRPGHANNVHPAMFRQVASEANQWSPKVDVKQVVSFAGLIRALILLVSITAVLGVAVVFDSHRTTVLLKRFWSPSTSLSATTLSDLPGDLVVGRGESLEIGAVLEGLPVEQAMLSLDPSEGEQQEIVLVPRDDEQSRVTHRIRSVNAPLRYRIRAGDGQTDWHKVQVADRPELGDVRLTVIPPAYTNQEPTELEKLPRSITALEGSVLKLAFKVKEPVTKFELMLGGEQKETLSADAEGWYRWEKTLSESFALSPQLTEENGLTNRRPPKCEVTCRPDAPPAVNLISPETAIAVLPNDTVAISFAAKDDVGIGSAELVLYGEGLDIDGDPVPLATIPIPLGEQLGATEVQGTVQLDLSQYELADGTELTYAVRVSEDRGGQSSDEPVDGPELLADAQQPTGDTLDSAAQPQTDSTESSDIAAASEAEQEQPSASQPSTSEGSVEPPETGETASESPVGSPQDSQPTKTSPPEKSTEEKVSQPSRPAESSSAENEGQPEEKATESRTATSQRQGIKAGGSDDKKPETSNSASSSSTSAMSTRQLDVAQSTSSKRMVLKIDETAGSFSGQQRIKLEMAIAPRLEELGQALEKAQGLSRSVLDDLQSPEAWDSKHGRDTASAEKQVAGALKIVDQVEKRSKGTPYAFVGLQLVDISLAHIEPARRDFWKALQADGETRVEAVSNGWQHTGRALELLDRLTTRFDRARREYALAETVERIKKMYQVYVENSLALLRPEADEDLYSRKRVEFDLDEEYLARLKKVLEMRNELRAELARILAEDPRLLRRFLDAQRNRQNVLRNELADLGERQGELNRRTKAWTMVEQEERPQLASVLLQRHIRAVEDVALAAADLHDRFETWLPLQRNVEDTDLTATAELLQQIATATSEVSRLAGQYIGKQTQAKPQVDTEPPAEGEQAAIEADAPDKSLDLVVQEAEQLYGQFNQLEVLLRQIGLREDGEELSGFARNRLLETRRLIDQTSAWIRQLKSHRAGEYHRAAEVEQYRLAMATDSFAGKLANLEQNLSAILQLQDGMLPEPIAEKARLLLATLDEQVTPNQLAAVYALRRKQLSRATSRQEAALKALELAGRTYDEMMELTIIELDKLPVGDPIASLLQEPTLDELLRRLEQEADIAELLGIPCRPTNLQIIGDWMRPGSDNAMATGGANNQMLINQFREQQRKRQQAIEQAYRRALAKAMREANAENLVDLAAAAPALATKDWNVLASQLRDDLRQGRDSAPPERYRQAIEQYFRQISGSSSENTSSSK